MQEAMIFFKIVALNKKANLPFDIDFFVKKGFNNHLSSKNLQCNII